MPADSSASKEVGTAALLVIGGNLSGRTKDQNIGYVAECLTAVGGPWPVARSPQGGRGIEENSQGAETRARRRLEKVTQEPPGSRVGIGISASDPSHAVTAVREM
jgi:hypothetical protein